MNPGSQVLVLLTRAAPRPLHGVNTGPRWWETQGKREGGIGRQESAWIGWHLRRALKGMGEKRGTGRKKAPEKGGASPPPPAPPPALPWSEEGPGRNGPPSGLPPERMRAGRG